MRCLHIILVLALCCISKTKCNCGKYQYCTLLDWQSWEACTGQCGGITEQVRKRSVCVDTSKIQPFTVENVIAYCKFTEPLSEKKVCPLCPHGIFNATTALCDYCKIHKNNQMRYMRPEWFQYLEISLLVIISLILLMVLGCLCRKCCIRCGCCYNDDKDDDNHEGKERLANCKVQKPRSFMKNFV